MSASTGLERQGRMRARRRRDARSGLSLIELVIAIALLGIITAGLFQAVSQASSLYRGGADRQDMLSQGNYALARMALFIRETSGFNVPSGKKIQVDERVLDRFDNTTHQALPGGDGILDADNDVNGLVDDDKDFDPEERVTFELVSGLLLETLPNYGTAPPGDELPAEPICDHVSDLQIKKLANDLVQIRLVLDDGQSRIELFTRVKARIMVP